MAKKHLSRNPKGINLPGEPKMWFYEETHGLSIYNDTGFVAHIPSRAIRAYIKRKDKRDD